MENIMTFTQLIIDSTAVDKYPRIYHIVHELVSKFPFFGFIFAFPFLQARSNYDLLIDDKNRSSDGHIPAVVFLL